MGPVVIPLILNTLKNNPDFWFPALVELTGANPVHFEDRGQMAKMSKSWLKWGRENGYLQSN